MKKLLLILLFLFYVSDSYAALQKPYFFYRNETQHDFLYHGTKYDVDCENTPVTNTMYCVLNPESNGGSHYLYRKPLTVGDGQIDYNVGNSNDIDYMFEAQPTFRFNIDDDSNGSIYYQIEIATDSGFSSLVISYISDVFTDSSTDGVDVEYQIGQTGGTYSTGEEGISLGVYGTETDYYWRIRACSDSECSVSGDYLYSGGDRTASSAEIGFTYPAYFCDDSTNQEYEVLSNQTTSSVSLTVLTPFTINDFKVKVRTVGGDWVNNCVSENVGNGAIECEISNLNAGTLYQYQLEWSDSSDGETTHTGNINSFYTSDALDSTNEFSFIISTDIHVTEKLGLDSIINNINTVVSKQNKTIKFWIDNGDFVIGEKAISIYEEQAKSLYARTHKSIAQVADNIPYYAVIGNHENFNTSNDDLNTWFPNYSTNTGIARDSFFAFPDNNYSLYDTFYSWEFGSSLFLVIDYYYEGASVLGDVQKEWIYNKIKDNINSKKWIFIFLHTYKGGSADGWNTTSSTDNWMELAGKYKNIVVFFGHSHGHSYGRYNQAHLLTCPSIHSYPGISYNDYNTSVYQDGLLANKTVYGQTYTGQGTITSVTLYATVPLTDTLAYYYYYVGLENTTAPEEFKVFSWTDLWSGTAARNRRTFNHLTVSSTWDSENNRFGVITYSDSLATDWQVGDVVDVITAGNGYTLVTVNQDNVNIKLLDVNGENYYYDTYHPHKANNVSEIRITKGANSIGTATSIGTSVSQ